MESNERRGKNWRAKYLTIEAFNNWKGQDFCHLVKDVKFTKRLLIGVLCAVIVLPTIFMICVVQILAG